MSDEPGRVVSRVVLGRCGRLAMGRRVVGLRRRASSVWLRLGRLWLGLRSRLCSGFVCGLGGRR